MTSASTDVSKIELPAHSKATTEDVAKVHSEADPGF